MDFKKDIYQDPDIKKYVKIIARDPRAFASLANALLNKGYVDEAISVCEEGLEADPDFIAGRAVLGKCYVKDGKIDKAQEEFEAILEQNHDNVVALIGLGEIYYSMEEYSGALEMYERLLFIDPMNEEFQEMVEKIKGLQSGAIPAPPRAEPPVKAPEGEEEEEAAEPLQDEEPYPEEPVPSFDRESTAEEPPPVSPGETLVTADSVDALLNLIGETIVRARHVLERGFDESNQLLFNRLASGTNRSVWEEVNRRLDSYLSKEADEGEIVPIERGVSPHKSEEIEIDGTENIGIASRQEVKIDQNIVSYDSIVSNDQIAYESVAVSSEEDTGRPPEEEIPETTLKGADALNMDLEESEGADEESLIPENDLGEQLSGEPVPSPEEDDLSVPPPETDGGLQEEVLDAEEEILDEEDDLLDEGLEEISEEGPAALPEEDIEPALSPGSSETDDIPPAFDSEETLSQEEGGEGFREDSYPSLEEDVSHPQDLNALMAEAEKSLSGAGIETDEGLEDDIMDELEAETRSLQDAKNREAFSGESLVHLDEESSLTEGDNDKFAGHQEIDVGSVEPSGEREENRFQGHDELEMTETAIPKPSAPQPSSEQMEPPSDLDLKEEPLTPSIQGTGEISIDETGKDNDNADELVDADDETLDDIGKWLNDL